MHLDRRRFLKFACASLAAATSSPAAAHRAPRKPNIVLCMADDQGFGDMAYNGHPVLQTPNFDAFAAAALRFDRFYAAAPVCSPTRGSVMTGRHPNRFGCFKWGHGLRPQEITVAEALKTAGYATGHFGKWHLGSVLKGSPVNPGASGFDEWFSAPNFFDNDPIMSRRGKAVPAPGESSMITVEAALEFIRKRAKSRKPFLAVVWFGSPHNPHQALDEDLALYPDESENRRHFYGEITAMDRAFGTLRHGLRTLGIADNTLLWYCSDNGGLPNLGSTGGRANKGSIYEGGLRVPAVLEWPARITAPRVTAVPANTSDIYPTLLEIAAVAMPDQPPLDGISLVPLIGGRMDARPQPMGFWDHPTPGITTPSKPWMESLHKAQLAGRDIDDPSRLRLDAAEIKQQYPTDSFPGHAAWLDWPWKLHRIENNKTGAVKYELYNLANDPIEQTNLHPDRPNRAQPMKEHLNNWLLSVVNSLNGKDYR